MDEIKALEHVCRAIVQNEQTGWDIAAQILQPVAIGFLFAACFFAVKAIILARDKTKTEL